MRSAGLSRAELSDDRGFTLLEVLVSLAIFAMIVVGAVGVLGASNGGLFAGFPTGFVTARTARDITAASVYLNALEEFVADRGRANAAPGSYCVGIGCPQQVALPPGLSGYPTPPGEAYQLDWTRLDVLIELWYWDNSAKKFAPTATAFETLPRVRATLTWQIRDATRSLTVDRFIR